MRDHSSYSRRKSTVWPVVNLSHAPKLVLIVINSTNPAKLRESAWEQNYSHKFLEFSGSKAHSVRNKNPTLGPSGSQMKREARLLVATGLFPKSPENFWVYFGCNNSPYIFATPRFLAINLCNPHYITSKTC